MRRARYIASNPLAAVLDEALGAVLSPGIRGDVLTEAVAVGGLDAVPRDPSEMRLFLEGPLFSTLARHIAISDALELLSQVRSALELALGHSDEAPRSDIRERPWPARTARTTALVVTPAAEALFFLADLLGEDVDVVSVASASELRQQLARGTPRLVLVDRRQGVDPQVYDVLLDRLTRSPVVLLWGGAAVDRANDSTLSARLRLVTTPPTLRLGELGALCLELLHG